MKEIKAIIQPHMLSRVLEALHALPHFPGVTVSECHGQGRGRGTGGQFEATQEEVFLRQMTKVELWCGDAVAEEFVRTIRQAAHTGNPGDGIVTVTELSRVVRIRSGEEADAAV